MQKNQKLIGGQKCYATFSDFSFWALPDQKMAGSKKNGWQNFSTIIVLVWGQSWKKVVYITMPKYLIFHFHIRPPIWAKKGPPVPLEGSGGEIWPPIGFLFTGHSYKPIKSKIKNFCWPVCACIYVRRSVNTSQISSNFFAWSALTSSLRLKR